MRNLHQDGKDRRTTKKESGWKSGKTKRQGVSVGNIWPDASMVYDTNISKVMDVSRTENT